MGAKKTFFRKYEVLIIVAVTLIFIYLLVFFNQKINFFLGNELIVRLTPGQKSVNLKFGETTNADFEVRIDNVAYCRADCRYTFTDRSKNKILDKGEFILNKKEKFGISYGIGVAQKGSGKEAYSFDVNCNSIKSIFCLTKEEVKSRSSLMVLNFDLNDTEKKAKIAANKSLTALLENLNDADISHQKLNQKFFELSKIVNLKNVTREKIGINDDYDKLRISIENLLSLWIEQVYVKLEKDLDNSFFDSLERINKSIENLDKKIDENLDAHNSLLIGLNSQKDQINKMSELIKLSGNDSIVSEYNMYVKNFNIFGEMLINNTLKDFHFASSSLERLENQKNMIENEVKDDSLLSFVKIKYYLNYENQKICELDWNCEEKFDFFDIINSTQNFMDNHPDSAELKTNCGLLNELEKEVKSIQNDALKLINDSNITFNFDENFNDSVNLYKFSIISNVNNSIYALFEEMISQNKVNGKILNLLKELAPSNLTPPANNKSNNTRDISFYYKSKISLDDNTAGLLDKCANLNNTLDSINDFDFSEIQAYREYDIVQNIDVILPDRPPICCVFAECKPCCKDESCNNYPKSFPVILLHGHSFAKINSPEFSLDSFNKLQSRMQEDGYLSAGTISFYSINENFEEGAWSLSGRPITVKASYYFDAFLKEDKYILIPTKSENIDTYAIRLKDLIEIVKKRTGKTKVNIISHSMGGLVARRYIQIFGEGDVDKLIMIATPNKGVSGTVGNFCGLIGENRECQDMLENSLFMNKLNDPQKQSNNVEMFTIIGNGCKMKFDVGDGVVTRQSAALENSEIFYVNGTCSFGETLHTEILDIAKYPETYEIIKEIMK